VRLGSGRNGAVWLGLIAVQLLRASTVHPCACVWGGSWTFFPLFAGETDLPPARRSSATAAVNLRGEALGRDVRIDHGCSDVGVTHQDLHLSEIEAVPQ